MGGIDERRRRVERDGARELGGLRRGPPHELEHHAPRNENPGQQRGVSPCRDCRGVFPCRDARPVCQAAARPRCYLWHGSKNALLKAGWWIQEWDGVECLAKPPQTIAQLSGFGVGKQGAGKLGALRSIELAVDLRINECELSGIGHVMSLPATPDPPAAADAPRKAAISLSFPEASGCHPCPGSSSA